ncbi:class I SAM-dependent methyltransferase [Pasteuria penetrans]|uniref:class I SAM-dependent methyltransferase n=1 Tax=Pasteuria penetrans TaxID=86005 RepID=UPI000F94D5DB|nr:class I SAM-dependent methyltransferase [Pasteuria penetrans]
MEHYYTRRPTSTQPPRVVTSVVDGETLRFWVSSGVFSARRVDPGSQLLLSAVTVEEGGRILDLGCGYGFIGIGLALKNPSSRVVMVDINERAVELAQRNASMHNVRQRMSIYVGDGLSAVAVDPPFSTIVTNPPVRVGKALIHQWFAAAPTYLTPGGSLWLVLRKQQGAASMQRSLSRWFAQVRLVSKRSGYRVLQASLSKLGEAFALGDCDGNEKRGGLHGCQDDSMWS